MITFRCPFFLGRYLLSCKAGEDEYMPSSFEITEYCESYGYKICPIYLKKKTEKDLGVEISDLTVCDFN